MGISYVGTASYSFAGAADTDIRAAIPSGVLEGDLLVCAFGNVGSASAASTMNNAWTMLKEDTSGTNAYFLMAAKIATATEVSAIGSDVSIATKATTNGQTNKTSQLVAYRGTWLNVSNAILGSEYTHEDAPADMTINTNNPTSAAQDKWGVFFANMADTSNQSTGTWSVAPSGTIRGQVALNNGSSTTSGTCAGDSAAYVAASAYSRNMTWSLAGADRLNGGMVYIQSFRPGAPLIMEQAAQIRAHHW